MAASDKDPLLAMGLDELDRAIFRSVLSKLHFDRIATLGSSIRQYGHRSTGGKAKHPVQSTCQILPKVNCGSYHAVVTLTFVDSLEWILKVPDKGHTQRWTSSAAKALKSEAQTMRLIHRETSIPVPEVLAFDASIDNELGCPFILMEKVQGRELSHGWFHQDMSDARREQFRARSLQGIAETVAQLDHLAFDQGGSLSFNAEGEVVGVGTRYFVDFVTSYQRLCDQYDGEDETQPFQEVEPFQCPKSYFTTPLDHRGRNHLDDPYTQGAYSLLRLFIDWAYEGSQDTGESGFVLAHPDFDTQNIFTAEDGTLTGIIDWDWVAAMPRAVGCLKLPSFLMNDYNPAFYMYDVKAGRPDEGHDECSPAQLKCYRAMYTQFMEKHIGKLGADVTRRSLVMNSLDTASNDPMITLKVVGHLFRELERLTEGREELVSSDTESDVASEVDEDLDDIDRMSFRECLEEIEKLCASSENRSLKAETPELCGYKMKHSLPPDAIPVTVETVTKYRKSYGRKFGRYACGWGSKKFRGAAEILHRKDNKDDSGQGSLNGVLPSKETVITGTARRTRNLCQWLQARLEDLDQAFCCEATFGDGMKTAAEGSLRKVLCWLHRKFEKTISSLHRKAQTDGFASADRINIKSPVGSTGVQTDTTQKQEAGADNLKKAACGEIALMLKNDELLTDMAHKAIARWLVRSLRSEAEGPEPKMYDAAQALEEFHEDQESVRVFNHNHTLEKVAAALKRAQEQDPIHVDGAVAFGSETDGKALEESNVTFPNHHRVLGDSAYVNSPELSDDGNTKETSHFDVIFPYHNRHCVNAMPSNAEGLQGPAAGRSSDHGTPGGEINGQLISVAGPEFEVNNNNLSHDSEKTTLYREGKTEEDDSNIDNSVKMGKADEVISRSTTNERSIDIGGKNSEDSNATSSDGIGSQDSLSGKASTTGTSLQDTENETTKNIGVDESDDMGTFTMWDVCMGLSKGTLDERRMKRLREGFFALLNQTI